MSEVKPTGDAPHYKQQFKVSPEFKKFWNKLFHGAQISEIQYSQLTDQLTNQLANDIKDAMNRTIKEMKKNEKREKGEDPD